jgi:hypothetical protein
MRAAAQIIDEIERVAKNKLEPRETIVRLCDEARHSLHNTKPPRPGDPFAAKVRETLKGKDVRVDEDGMLCIGEEYMTTMLLLLRTGLPKTPANLARVGRTLGDLGYVKVQRTRLHPQARWYAPQGLV